MQQMKPQRQSRLKVAAEVGRVYVLIEDQSIQEYHEEVKKGFEVKEENQLIHQLKEEEAI